MSREFQQLIRRAHRAREARARLIVEECLERLPHYRGPPESLREEIRESTLHHLALFYRVTLETGRQLSPEDLEFSRQLAQKRAVQGVPLGEFLTFFLVGLTRAWEHLVASAGDDARLRDELLERVAAVISNQTQLMTALTESYVEERERRSRSREQDLDDFFHLLLAEEAVPSVIEDRAAKLGIALGEPRTIAVFGSPIPVRDETTSAGAEDVRRCLATAVRVAEVWVGRSRDGFVSLLPEFPEPGALAAAASGLFGADGRVGVGSPGRGVEGLRRSAREASRALQIGRVLGGSEPVQVYADVAVLDLVGIDSARAEEFMRDVLGPLTADDVSPSYLETLRQLSTNNYSLKLAAAALSVHPHTLSYRVRQIRQRFGFDLDDPDVRLRVQLALLILDARSPVFAAPRP